MISNFCLIWPREEKYICSLKVGETKKKEKERKETETASKHVVSLIKKTVFSVRILTK